MSGSARCRNHQPRGSVAQRLILITAVRALLSAPRDLVFSLDNSTPVTCGDDHLPATLLGCCPGGDSCGNALLLTASRYLIRSPAVVARKPSISGCARCFDSRIVPTW